MRIFLMALGLIFFLLGIIVFFGMKKATVYNEIEAILLAMMGMIGISSSAIVDKLDSRH